MSYNEAWAKYLGPTSPFMCKLCFDGIAESADISFGDAWYCDENNYPDFEEKDGRNLIIARSENGRNIVNGAKKAEYIHIENIDVDIKDFERMQPSQTSRRYLALYKFWGNQVLNGRYPKVSKLQLKALSKYKTATFKRKLRTMMGTVKRGTKARKVEVDGKMS